jgi:arginase
MGPSAVRLAGLNTRLDELGYEVQDLGNVAVEQQESTPTVVDKAKYLPQIAKTCERLAVKVEAALGANQFPLVLGGDHSIAVGTVSGVSRVHRQAGEKIGLLWLDAHADMNTPETSPSGNVHGMPLACCVGRGPQDLTDLFGYRPKVDGRNVALVGIRDVDRTERQMVRESGVTPFTMREIDELGLRRVMEQAISIATDGTAGFHLSFDMDFVDPLEAPGVGTPVRGGVTYREAHLAMEVVCDSGQMLSLEIVEVNPVLDEVNRTAQLAVELALSAMGKRIL